MASPRKGPHIGQVLSAADSKDRMFYSRLSEEDRKGVGLFPLIRYMSTSDGDVDMQSYFLAATNEYFNKNFFALKDHPELQWLCATTVSPMPMQNGHKWLSFKKGKSKVPKNLQEFVLRLYPEFSDEEIDLFVSLHTAAELEAIAEDMGMSKDQIKKELKARP